MQCPKCGKEQSGTEKCDICGVVFEKYRRYLELREQREIAESLQQDTSSGLPVTLIVVVVLCLLAAVGGYFYFRQSAPPGDGAVAVATAANSAPAASPAATDATFSGLDLVSQLNEKSPPGNVIEQARNATVFLQTEWGLGSGFFVDDACTIVTNKHVIKLSDENALAAENTLKKLRSEADSVRYMINSNKEVVQKIRRGEARSSMTPEAIEAKIREDEEKLAQFEQSIAEAEDKLGEFKTSTSLIAILADGTQLNATVSRISEAYDLAVVRLDTSASCPFIAPGNPDSLHQGDKLYTVGSPMGIKHTVTSGIFSGHTEIEGQSFLQTDASINPGNSGGPLIDQDGRVVGINTMILSNAQGIGFSIPINLAFQDLNLEPAAL